MNEYQEEMKGGLSKIVIESEAVNILNMPKAVENLCLPTPKMIYQWWVFHIYVGLQRSKININDNMCLKQHCPLSCSVVALGASTCPNHK